MTYAEKLKDPRWQRKRLEILERDGWACRRCTSTTKTLHVHHLKYGRDPWSVDDALLITLCDACHARVTEWAKKLALWFATLTQRMVGDESVTEFDGFVDGLLLDCGAVDHLIAHDYPYEDGIGNVFGLTTGEVWECEDADRRLTSDALRRHPVRDSIRQRSWDSERRALAAMRKAS